MVRFVDKPYTSKGVAGKISSIKWKMSVGIGMVKVHLITLSDNANDLFDIYPAAVFKKKHMRKSDRVVIGVADSYKQATGLVEAMINDCIKNGSVSDIRGYFEQFVKDHL